ncbi:MerR family transcriptional regulator [Rhodococcus maanshanensis]|uniref:DNA-binding transcriptional regulator, MerR family n=1 Tax=Rhodococcus maanshanensis TaxID=183556 RepID=A0A1H7F715_9NOCA|nr:MerR family transcriptional regulator [Rhodococcus maanshanensis]SEK21788.1 DNA-binding transcriptional regulator, MerR family [Rhodococcus maanshanensis]
MRIGDLAQTAGITPRTIRHYHRLGVLEEPRRLSNGYRVYELPDLIRLLRIRWLATAGVPLGSIATIMDSARAECDTDDLGDDLRALIDGIDAELDRLGGQRRRLQEMLDAHRDGRPVSPLPAELAVAFSELISAEDDPRTRREFERERDAWELLAVSGTGPSALFDAATRVLSDPGSRATIVSMYRRFAALVGVDPAPVEQEIDSLAEGFVSVIVREYGGTGLMGDGAESAAPMTRPMMTVAELVPDPAQREVVMRVLARLGSSLDEATA